MDTSVAIRPSSDMRRGNGSKRTQRKNKALVVEADYFALTSRVDPNVVFWGPGVAKADTQIPKGITHLWISSFVSDNVRFHLINQARERKIEVWNCAIGMLRERLLSFWVEPTNRSLVEPADPDADLDESFNNLRRRLLKEAAARAKAGQADLTVIFPTRGNGMPARPVDPVALLGGVRSALEKFPLIDREVFVFHYGLNGQPNQEPSLANTASEFAIPAMNVRRMLDRTWSKLPKSGFFFSEEELLAALRDTHRG